MNQSQTYGNNLKPMGNNLKHMGIIFIWKKIQKLPMSDAWIFGTIVTGVDALIETLASRFGWPEVGIVSIVSKVGL